MRRPLVDVHVVVEETLAQCVLADQMGFDTVWFVEHHFPTTFSGSPCPEVMFGALSRMTKRIRLGFGVVILPYHHPVRVVVDLRPLHLEGKAQSHGWVPWNGSFTASPVRVECSMASVTSSVSRPSRAVVWAHGRPVRR